MGKDNVDIPAPRRTDIKALQDLAERAAERNISRSIALEEQYAPNLAKARGAYEGQLLADIQRLPGLQAYLDKAAKGLSEDFDVEIPGVELERLAANPIQDKVNAATMQDLDNLGQLPLAVRNQVARASAQSAGQGGYLGSRAAGGYSARDLGLSALGLRDQQLSRGNLVGQQERALAQQQQAMQAQIQQVNRTIAEANKQRRLQTAGQLQSVLQPSQQSMAYVGNTPRPTAGLGPGDIASIQVAQDNAANQYALQSAGVQAQQQNANQSFWGGIAGLGLGALLTPISGKSLIGRAF